MGSRVEGDAVGCTARVSVGRPRVHGGRVRRRRGGGGEEGGEESGEGEALTNPIPNHGRGLSHARWLGVCSSGEATTPQSSSSLPVASDHHAIFCIKSTAAIAAEV